MNREQAVIAMQKRTPVQVLRAHGRRITAPHTITEIDGNPDVDGDLLATLRDPSGNRRFEYISILEPIVSVPMTDPAERIECMKVAMQYMTSRRDLEQSLANAAEIAGLIEQWAHGADMRELTKRK